MTVCNAQAERARDRKPRERQAPASGGWKRAWKRAAEAGRGWNRAWKRAWCDGARTREVRGDGDRLDVRGGCILTVAVAESGRSCGCNSRGWAPGHRID